MTARPTQWSASTRWWSGDRAVEQCIRALPGAARTALVTDAGMAGTTAGEALVDRVRRELARSGEPVAEQLHDPSTTTVETVRDTAARWREAGVERVVAVGGGATLDLAVLGTLPPALLDGPAWRSRCGLIALPPARAAATRVLVPTTLGTGAEVSTSACVERGDGKVLAVGAVLRGDEAVVDPAATDGLPVHLCAEAGIEVLARLLVPFAGPGSDTGTPLDHADEHVLADLRALARPFTQVADALAVGAEAGRAARLALATVSAHSHLGWGHLGRSPFSSPVWYVATELAAALGVGKVPATAVLLPVWARVVLRGDVRWGSAARLRRAWGALATAQAEAPSLHPPLPPDPVAGLAEAMARLVPGLPGPHGADVADTVADRCARRWGGGLPMLAGLDTHAVAALVADALATGPSALDLRELSCST
ncbi:iron-containing alcohol dehydrogenase [Motilibacter aurantiacus]|uniref:iron-containing alcohol dehydrogenase n=1 Tax=Motilibacter aurantiacus TaxID=2714955 RepID=UPI001407BFF1|nr:iron-containing alcohol dehydrogenase [Motilibacter aurantiacus]